MTKEEVKALKLALINRNKKAYEDAKKERKRELRRIQDQGK
jgi:hypothetical protein